EHAQWLRFEQVAVYDPETAEADQRGVEELVVEHVPGAEPGREARRGEGLRLALDEMVLPALRHQVNARDVVLHPAQRQRRTVRARGHGSGQRLSVARAGRRQTQPALLEIGVEHLDLG